MKTGTEPVSERATVKDIPKKRRFSKTWVRVFGILLSLLLVCGAVMTGYALRYRSHYKISFYQETSSKVSSNIRIAVISDIHTREYGEHNEALLSDLRALKPDLILFLFHTEGPCVLCWLPRLLGKKVVVTIHGLDHQQQKWGKFASSYIMLGEKMAVRYAHSIIVLSRGVQAYFRERYGRETVLIPNGIDPAEIRPASEITEQFGLSSRDYILFLGRLVPEKGIHYLIEAYQKLSTDKKLVIAGRTSDTDDYVKRLQEMAGDDPSVIFNGFQQGLVLEELYSNAYLYVLPSDLEGMPLTLLEAMNYGCCCVTSDNGECADVMNGCGITFPRGNAEALREALQDLCDHPEKAEAYRMESRKTVSSKYTWQEITTKMHELYRTLLKERGPGQ